jgi:hypothetical protein
MTPAEQLVAAVAALAATHDLRRRAFDGCRGWMRQSAGDVRGWSPDEIELHFHACSLVFEHGLLSYPFLDTRLGLYVRDDSGVYLDDLRPVGHYRLITRLDGSADDDYFVIDTAKPPAG